MANPSVYFVGQPHEVAHHAAPFQHSLNVTIADPQNVLERSQPGDLAIFFSEHFDRFRNCCLELKKRNVATLYLVDGILEWRNAWENSDDEVACPYTMRPVLSHKVACIGQSQARVLHSWGNAGKIEVVGIPRLDHHWGKQSNRGPSNEDFRVLVMTAKTPGFTPQQRVTVRESLLDLKHWQAENPMLGGRKTEFIWRLTGELADQIGVENQLSDLSGQELADVLTNVDAVITTPSTAMLEAMLLKLPVAVLDYHNCPHYVTGGWDICGREHIGPTITQMAERAETRMMFQQTQLADSLCGPGNSSERLVDLIEQMMKISAEQIEANQPLAFPAQILETTPLAAAEFSYERLYENAPEFSNNDLNVIQVELSHARREISHLHGELAQIQSELGQAHQIFEQIEKHPIAGPIVRIRQKMLDLMAAIRKRKNKLDSAYPPAPANPPNSQAETPLN